MDLLNKINHSDEMAIAQSIRNTVDKAVNALKLGELGKQLSLNDISESEALHCKCDAFTGAIDYLILSGLRSVVTKFIDDNGDDAYNAFIFVAGEVLATSLNSITVYDNALLANVEIQMPKDRQIKHKVGEMFSAACFKNPDIESDDSYYFANEVYLTISK